MKRIKEYNKDTGILFIIYGIVIAFFEIPAWVLGADLSAVMIIISMPIILIVVICIYEFKIYAKYKIK